MDAIRTYRALDPDKVIETIGQLRNRITERVPGAGLGEVCAELLQIAQENTSRAELISRSNMPLRLAIFALLAVGSAALIWIALLFRAVPAAADNVYSVLQGV